MKQAVSPCYMAPQKVHFLFAICWAAYFCTYIGRSNFSAALAEIIRTEGYSNAACGLVGTGFFICYGVGQLFSGCIGDRIHPRIMIFTGISVSALCNLLMAFTHSAQTMLFLWCLNGTFQSMTWSPIVRTIAEYFPPEYRKKACLKISTTYPAGILTTYALSAGLIYCSGWRLIFIVSFIIMAVVAVVWLLGFGYAERFRTEPAVTYPKESSDIALAPKGKCFSTATIVLLLLIGLLLAMQGALRDGVMTWVPSYLSNTFSVGTTLSIFCTTVLPVVNLVGVQAAGILNGKFRFNELQISCIFFGTASVAALVMMLLSGSSLFLSVVMFSVITSSMMGVNIMLVSFVPTYFVQWGKVSFVSGLVNSMVYIGSSIATYGIGAIADAFGWGVLLMALFSITLLGIILCLVTAPKWKRFLSDC